MADEQGHAPYAWTVLGAVAQATERVELMTYVTCPTMRYHPAVVAQKAATLQLLADGRFILGLGSGENLNEHVVGRRLAGGRGCGRTCSTRRSRSSASCTPASWSTWAGEHFRVDSARIWDLPDAAGRRSAVAVSGDDVDRAVRAAGRPPHRRRARRRRSSRRGTPRAATAAGRRRRKIGQIPICWGPDKDAAIEHGPRAVPLVRRRLARQRRPADAGRLRRRRASSCARRTSPTSIPCGPDLDALVEAVRPFLRGRVHRRRAGPDRRRGPGGVPRPRRRAAAGASCARV